MAMEAARGDREYKKFVETTAGETAIRTKISDFDGDININAETNSVSTSGLVGKASGDNADFITAYATGTTLTCTTLPTGTSKITAADVVSIMQIATDGSVTKFYFRDDTTLSAAGTDPTTLTVTGATFLNTDTFIVYTNIERIQDKIN